jgi:ParB family chromosome partitioning protein
MLTEASVSVANLHTVCLRVNTYKAADGTILLDRLVTDEEEYAGQDETPDEIDTRVGELEAAMEKIKALLIVFNPTDIGRAGAFVKLDRYCAFAVYRSYDQLTSEESIENGITPMSTSALRPCGGSDNTWEGSTHLLQNIQNVCIFCTNGDPDHARASRVQGCRPDAAHK